MTDQTAIPFIYMRGGTSKGPVFNKKDLPQDQETLGKVLIAAVGAGHQLNIDGIGAGNSVTTKVPILSKSNDKWADVDYFFVQVQALKKIADFSTTCGNMLSAVGPAGAESMEQAARLTSSRGLNAFVAKCVTERVLDVNGHPLHGMDELSPAFEIKTARGDGACVCCASRYACCSCWVCARARVRERK